MKYILFLLLLVGSTAFGQTTYFIRADSTKLEKVGGNNELILKNGTRSRTGAYLKNISNGITGFFYAIDSAYVSGGNLVLVRGGGTQNITLAAGGVGGYNSNVGSGYRWAIPNTNQIKTFTATNGLTLDSATSNQLGIKLGGTLTANTDINMGGGWLLRFYESAPRYISYDGYDFNMRTSGGQKFDVQILNGSSETSQLKLSDGEFLGYTQSVALGTQAKVRTNQDIAEIITIQGADQASAVAFYSAGVLRTGITIHPQNSINYGVDVDNVVKSVKIGKAVLTNTNNYRGLRVDSLWQVYLDSVNAGGSANDSVLVIKADGQVLRRNAAAFGGSASTVPISGLTATTGTSGLTIGHAQTWTSSLTTATPLTLTTSTITSGNILSLVSTSTAATSAVGLNVHLSGTLAGGQTTKGINVSNTNVSSGFGLSYGVYSAASGGAFGNISSYAIASGAGAENVGFLADASDATTNNGVWGRSSGTGTTNYGGRFSAAGAPTNYGVFGLATGAHTTNIGGFFYAAGASNNYSIQVGSPSGQSGNIRFMGTTSGAVLMKVADAAGTYTLTLPTDDGNASDFLQTNGSGVLSWAAASGGGGSPAGNYGNVQINRNGAFATPGSDSLDFDAGLNVIGPVKLNTVGGAGTGVEVTSSANNLYASVDYINDGATRFQTGIYGTATAKPNQAFFYNPVGNIGFTAGGTERLLVGASVITMSSYGAGTATFDASGNISSVSDERLKNVQGKYTAGLAEVKKINPISYKWNEKSGMEMKHTYYGFSAQNILSALGEDAIGRNDQGYMSVQDRAILAVAINSIKELSEKVDKLEKEIKKLKKKK